LTLSYFLYIYQIIFILFAQIDDDKNLNVIASIILLILHETVHHFIRFYSINEEYQKLLFFTPEKELQDGL